MEFECLTIQGDTLEMNDLIKEKPWLLANYSGCTSRSYNVFKKLNSECEESLQIIGIEYEINKIMHGINGDVEQEFEHKAKHKELLASNETELL